MFFFLFTFILGLGLLLFSTEKLVRLAERISKVLRISPLIIGITVVAIGTSIPEFVVSVISIIKHDANLAFGNIIGSNIVNVLLVLPVGILIGRLKIGRFKTQLSAFFLLVSTIIFFMLQRSSNLSPMFGIALISLAGVFSMIEYRMGVNGRDHEDAKQNMNKKVGTISLAQVIIGVFLLILVIAGGILIVDSVESISILSGLSTSILGLTLTAIATSLPELLTTIYSQNDNQEKVTVGNIIGSNIYNLLLIGGILLLFPSSAMVTLKEWGWLGGTTIGFFIFLKYYSGKKPTRLVGIFLLAVLLIYLRFQ